MREVKLCQAFDTREGLHGFRGRDLPWVDSDRIG